MDYDYKKLRITIREKCVSKGGVVKYFKDNAKILDCSYCTLGNWGKKHSPSFDKLNNLCEHFNININDFKQD